MVNDETEKQGSTFKLNVSDTYKNILAKCNKKSKEDATM